jgi:DNA-binding beta-propeller fold protein YncE
LAASLTVAASGCGSSSLSGDASADAGGSAGPGLSAGGLFVTAVDPGSQPLAGVTVTTDPGATSLITDDFGTVLIRNLSPGFYAVTGVHPTAGAARAAVNVTAGAVTQVRLVLGPVFIAPGSDGGVIDLGQRQDLPAAPDGGKDAGTDSADGGAPTVTLATPTKDSNGINLSWTTTPGAAITSYRVYRAAAGGGFEIINVGNDPTKLTYRDDQPKLGVTYSYRVGAVLSPTREAQSNVQMITAGIFIAIDTQVSAMLADRRRPYLYAVDTVNNSLLFVNTSSNMLEKTIFIGSRPIDLDINPAGTELYVANFGATEVAVVNLETREKTRALAVDTQVGTWDGNPYRLACTAGDTVAFTSMDQWQNIKLVNAATGTNLDVAGDLYAPDLVASPDGSHLYASGDGLVRYDVTGGKMVTADSLNITSSISGHLSVSGDDKYLFVGNKKILTKNLQSTLGTFSESILLANNDGSIAIGAQHVFDGNTFAVVRTLPLVGSALALSADEATLYIYDQMTSRIYLYGLK